MIESILVTILPVVFLIVLFGGGALSRRRGIDVDGDPPINKAVFLTSKYAIVALWAAMVAESWGASLSYFRAPIWVGRVAVCLWALGFLLLFSGRLGLGGSFRIGSPREVTGLEVGGLFRFSRNPMYLGVFATLLAAVLATMNPIVLAVALFVAAVHHRIVLAEERYLEGVFGVEYAEYCTRVRRYL